jgi:bleomycin hydrolase
MNSKPQARGIQVINYRVIFILVLISASFLSSQPLKERIEKALIDLLHPKAVQDFSVIFHLSSINQDSTLICWSFATSSFIESEMQRLGRQQVRLSVMFPVYYAFVEKAKRFIQTHGDLNFSPGDLFSGVLDIMQQYGAVPQEAYEGDKKEYTIYNHKALYEKLDSLMNNIKSRGDWNEKNMLTQVEIILRQHLGTPPENFIYQGKKYTPGTFLSEIVNLPWEEYVIITSFQYAPFYQFIELKVPDNWKHNVNYFNVPLNEFYSSLVSAVKNGYSVTIDMDNSELSYRTTKRFAFIPEFDVPRDSITQSRREEQFLSGATTDDHVMHLVSYRIFGDQDWFLAKDSWRTAWEGANRGYFFFHESYVKLKVLAYLVHRNGVPEITRLLPAN